VTSTGGPIGGGPSALPGDRLDSTTYAAAPYHDMGAQKWDTANGGNTNVITIDFSDGANPHDILSDWDNTSSFTIKQVNPAFVVYEADLKEHGGTYDPDLVAGTGYYPGDQYMIWSNNAANNGGTHILYKERPGYSVAALKNFNILIMNLPDPADEVVVLTFTYDTSGGTVTKSLRIDYSDVKFFDATH
jgi:hypothetical protein